MATDAADLFCEIYDALDTTPLEPREVNDWLTDEQVADIASMIEGQVLETGFLDEEDIRTGIEMADDPDRRRFAYLCGIDNALLQAHPNTASQDSAGLTSIATRYAESGRYNTELTEGALIPRFAFPADRNAPAETIRDAMVAVVRVGGAPWSQTDHTVIPNRRNFQRRDRERGVLFGCVPLLDRLDELEWTHRAASGKRYYRGVAAPSTGLRARIQTVLRRLDEQGVMVGVIPELCASAEIIEWWQEEITAHPTPKDSNLRWVFVGSGPLDGEQESLRNTGVMLDRLTGEIVMRQDKLNPFTLNSNQIRSWNLGEYVGQETAIEDISPGEKITVAESGLGRLVILICEDLARTMTVGPPLLAHGVSHAICPVFSDEIELHHWEHNKAKEYADQVGTQVVVSNSRAIGCDQAQTTFGTALAHSPHDTSVGSTSAADEIVLFRLSDEAAIWAIGRTAGFEGYEETQASEPDAN